MPSPTRSVDNVDLYLARGARAKPTALLTGLCLAGLMIPLELSMVAMALPDLERQLGIGIVGGAWVVDSYMVAFASLVLAAGALADRLGHFRVLLVGMILFGATAMLCGAAGTAGVLIAARIAQGIGAALTMSASLGVLANQFRGNSERFRAFGVFTTAIGIGMASGPMLGGALAATVGWRATFYVHVPVAVIATALLMFADVADAHEGKAPRFDLAGTSLATASLALGVGALIESGSMPIIEVVGVVAAVTVLGALFVTVEQRTGNPVFDFALLHDRAFAGAQLTALAYSSAFGALLIYLPRALETQSAAHAANPWSAGLALLPLTAPTVIVPLVAARLSRRLPPRAWLAGGLALAAVGACGTAGVLLASESSRSPWPLLPLTLILTGGGFAISNAHLTNVAMTAVSLARAGVASGMNFTVRQAGVAIGVAAAGRLYATTQPHGLVLKSDPAIAHVCLAASLVSLLGAALVWSIGPRSWSKAGES